MLKSQSIGRFISEWSQLILGIVLASIGLKGFLLPNGFLDGGVTGIAILVSNLTGLNVSVLLLIVSAPFIALAWFTLSKKIIWRSIIVILGLALFIELETFQPITDDKLLIAIFGGLFQGAGVGLTIKNGAVLDGSEILGVYINKNWGISIGRVILIFNVILFGFTAVLISTEVAMYSILTFLVTAKVVDLMIEGFEDYVGLMIVSDKIQEIETGLIEDIGVGMTVYEGVKGYGKRGVGSEKQILHTVINRIDIRRTYNLIDQIDEQAFIIEFDVNNVRGGILRKYLSKESIQKTIQNLNKS